MKGLKNILLIQLKVYLTDGYSVNLYRLSMKM